jgi:hypothetical protein
MRINDMIYDCLGIQGTTTCKIWQEYFCGRWVPTTFYDILPPLAQNKHKSKKEKKMKKW